MAIWDFLLMCTHDNLVVEVPLFMTLKKRHLAVESNQIASNKPILLQLWYMQKHNNLKARVDEIVLFCV